jgi:DUF1365 family protein
MASRAVARSARGRQDTAAVSNGQASAIYEGWVRHRRPGPGGHVFRYTLAMLYLDLAELPALIAGTRWWALERGRLAQFRRRDYFGDPAVPLDTAVRDRIEAELGERPDGPIRVLTHGRYFGLCFNPVSFYYCFTADGSGLRAVLAEITNTPWNERHAYALPAARAERSGERLRFRFDKAFHVSPFLEMELEYVWDFTLEGGRLQIGMSCLRAGREVFRADLAARREPLTAAALARALLLQPALSLSAFAAIYGQALRLRLKGAPFHVHPAKRVERAGALR